MLGRLQAGFVVTVASQIRLHHFLVLLYFIEMTCFYSFISLSFPNLFHVAGKQYFLTTDCLVMIVFLPYCSLYVFSGIHRAASGVLLFRLVFLVLV